MKKLLALAVLAALAVPAAAGDTDREFDCSNQCPLAQQANTHRANGGEAAATSAVVQADIASQVERNLARI
jgi:opacity protein-like surface antigen